MALYQVSLSRYCSCRSVARLVKKHTPGGWVKRVEDEPAPLGAVSVKVGTFRVDFLPAHREMMIQVFEDAQAEKVSDFSSPDPSYFVITGGARGELCVSPWMRQQVIKKLREMK